MRRRPATGGHARLARCERAEHEYRAAIERDPAYADAYVGLANTYNLLREYAGMPDAEAYPLAKANALKAIALDPNSSSGYAALGFAEYWGFWNVARARQAFARAVALDSSNATAHHWYATFLSNLGEAQAARREIDIAQTLDPNSLAIAADRGLILTVGGDAVHGMALLRQLSAANPGFMSPITYVANLSLDHGDYPQYLEATRRLAARQRRRGSTPCRSRRRTGLCAGRPSRPYRAADRRSQRRLCQWPFDRVRPGEALRLCRRRCVGTRQFADRRRPPRERGAGDRQSHQFSAAAGLSRIPGFVIPAPAAGFLAVRFATSCHAGIIRSPSDSIPYKPRLVLRTGSSTSNRATRFTIDSSRTSNSMRARCMPAQIWGPAPQPS